MSLNDAIQALTNHVAVNVEHRTANGSPWNESLNCTILEAITSLTTRERERPTVSATDDSVTLTFRRVSEGYDDNGVFGDVWTTHTATITRQTM